MQVVEGGPESPCKSWSAIVFSTTVEDTDNDGLLNIWEESTTGSLVTDPNGQTLPPLGSMGANPDIKDLFVEIGFLHAPQAKTYGGVQKPAHTHRPDPAALKMVGDAFLNAPTGEGLPGPINVHFDVGNYPTGTVAEPYLIRGNGLARGGEQILEEACNPLAAGCQYPAYPGTVGWKTGFRFLRDAWVSELGAQLNQAQVNVCEASGRLPDAIRSQPERHLPLRAVRPPARFAEVNGPLVRRLPRTPDQHGRRRLSWRRSHGHTWGLR